MATMMHSITMEDVHCGSCGFVFMMSRRFKEICQETGRRFWCPSCGSALSWHETELDRIKKKLSTAEEQAKAWMESYDREQAAHDMTERRRRAAAGQVTKLRKRVGNGICPCCNRGFTDLRRHMQTKHPDFSQTEYVHAET